MTCTLVTCPACGFRGFDARYTEPEMGRIYAGYRGEAYYRVRHRWEPWYTQRVNQGVGQGPEELRTRKAHAVRLINSCLNGSAPARILDYGGDRGQFMPDHWPAERWVYEVSDHEPLPGIQKLSELTADEQGSFDLVLLSHVLEHLPQPAGQLDLIRGLLSDQGLLYVEVPLERPDLSKAGLWPFDAAGLRWLVRHPWLLRLVDLYSTYFRLRKGRVPTFGFLKASEHINFFTQESLVELLTRAGYQVTECETLHYSNALVGAADAITCVARKMGYQGLPSSPP